MSYKKRKRGKTGLQVCNFIKKRLQHRCFPVNIAKCLRALILKYICERLLLKNERKIWLGFYWWRVISSVLKTIVQSHYFQFDLKFLLWKLLLNGVSRFLIHKNLILYKQSGFGPKGLYINQILSFIYEICKYFDTLKVKLQKKLS